MGSKGTKLLRSSLQGEHGVVKLHDMVGVWCMMIYAAWPLAVTWKTWVAACQDGAVKLHDLCAVG